MSSQPLSLSLVGYTLSPPEGAFRPLALDTSAGLLEARYHEAEVPRGAILWLGDAREGFATPAEGLYDRLAERFQALGAASLRVGYRWPADPVQRGLDALVCAFWLARQGFERIVVVGHGAGCEAALRVGLQMAGVTGVALLAPRAADAVGFEALGAKPRLAMLPEAPQAASAPFGGEGAGAALRCDYPGAGTDFAGAVDAVGEDLSDWLKERFGWAC